MALNAASVNIVVRLDRVIVEQFGMNVARNLVPFVKPGPRERHNGPVGSDIERRLDREGDIAMTVWRDGDCGRLSQLEIIQVPEIGLDDPPAADQAAV
ncbi:hypothetical protein [Sinorhizobium prairiense]|uniref:hypothetical protein n=1 Tax=Sinorhizobium sp. C101 TaxID=2976819 RepID=UPI0023D7BF05|nr:hypothetical protein [Sinorhizobium sp. C101]WEJ35637.1 hypothetical protein N0R80_00870 [Sinorhizobium sp. C101]